MKPWNVAFWAIAPSLYFRYQYKQTEDERVDNLWRIHENREKRELGPTRNSMGDYDSDEHQVDGGFIQQTQLPVSHMYLIGGAKMKSYLANPFSRFEEKYEKYPEELFNADEEILNDVDNYERAKPFQGGKDKTIGTSKIIPYMDTDEKYIHSDLYGENLYSNPPSENNVLEDMGIDEFSIWNFRKSLLN